MTGKIGAKPQTDDEGLNNEEKGPIDFGSLSDWSVTDIATDPQTPPEEQAAAMAEIDRRRSTNSFSLDDDMKASASETSEVPEATGASTIPETSEASEEEEEAERRQRSHERGARVNKQIRDFYHEQTELLKEESREDELGEEKIRVRRLKNAGELARRERERNKPTNRYREMRRGIRALKTAPSGEERDEILNSIAMNKKVEPEPSTDVDPGFIIMRKAKKLARAKFDRDYVRGAMEYIRMGFLEATPEQVFIRGFHEAEDYKIKGDSDAETPSAFWDINEEVLIPEISTKTPEQITKLEKEATLVTIYMGAYYKEWTDLSQPPNPHFAIPVRKNAEKFSEFVASKGIDPEDDVAYEISLRGFINTLEAIKFGQLEGQDDQFAELNWYFDYFNYGDEDNLEDLINVLQSHEEGSDKLFKKKADEFLRQRPEFLAYREKEEVKTPGFLIEIAKNAELYKFDDLMGLFDVDILPDGTILSRNRKIGNINNMGLLGEIIEDPEEKASSVGNKDSDEVDDELEGLLGEIESREPLPRLTGEEKTDRFVRFCIWIDRNVEKNPDCYLTRVTATRGGGMTRYGGVRFGLSDIQTNNILFESLDDTQDAAFSARGRTGDDASGLINMLANGTRTEVARRPEVMKHDHRSKGDITREERVYNDAWFHHFRMPFVKDSLQQDIHQASARIIDTESEIA